LLEESIEDSSSEAFSASSLSNDEPIGEPSQASRGMDDESAALIAQQAAAIASLTTQIQGLTKQQTVLTRDLHAKSNQEELNTCLESIESLQTEQKKTKRSVDAISAKKPVSAYVANGVAAVALLIGIGLAVQVYIASSQVTQLVEMMNTLQTQITTGPANDAAEKEMLQKQVDELTRLNSANTDQIAELSKALHSGGEVGHTATPGGDMGNQLTQLSNQDMQMGAAIESLQHKIAALEKGKAPVAVVAKPVVKKAEPVKENWMVNLVAFKQDWYAKRKAEEFAAKGVPAKVMKTETKGESWYRLSVDGFSSQYEAAAYAARVKKTLNLDSVWVNKN
jgi:DNA repair exonuclease SbcCD ATPase subunit